MKNARNSLTLAASVLGLLLPLTASAGNSNAVGVLKPDGYVTVNGHPVEQTTTLFSGDTVKCGPHSTAWIVRSGQFTRIPDGSEASFHEDKFKVASFKHDHEFDEEAEEHEHHNRDHHKCHAISPSRPKHHHQGHEDDGGGDGHHDRDCDDR